MSSTRSLGRRHTDAVAGLGLATVPVKPPRAPRVVLATVVKDLHMAKRYLPDLLGGVVQLGIRVVFFLFLSGIVSYSGVEGDDLTGKSLFVFFMSAMLPFAFMDTALNAPLKAVNADLMNGTLEYLYSNPSSRYAYFVGTVAARGVVNLVFFFPLYAFMVVYTGAAFTSMLMVLLACALIMVTLIAMGILVSLLGLLWRRIGSIVGVLGILFEMLAGAYAPVSEFPALIRGFAYALPFTWGYDLIRYYAFDRQWNTLVPVHLEWIILIVIAVFFTLVSRSLLILVERTAKEQGLHLI